MRHLAVYVVVLFSGALASVIIPENVKTQHDIEPYVFEDLINSTIEGVRSLIPDPIAIEDLNITIPEDIADLLQGSADVNNFEMTGLNKFQISYLNLALVGMQLNFTFVLPSLNINTNYIGDLVLASLIPLYGNGKANIHFEDVELEGSAQADLSNGISVKNLRIQLYVGDATFDIHGALDNEDFSLILSSILNDVVASFIDNHQDVISNILSPIVEGVINGILGGTDTPTTEGL